MGCTRLLCSVFFWLRWLALFGGAVALALLGRGRVLIGGNQCPRVAWAWRVLFLLGLAALIPMAPYLKIQNTLLSQRVFVYTRESESALSLSRV